MRNWLKLCVAPSVVRRAALTALVVGTILITINYGEAILNGELTRAQAVRMVLTIFVPYCVSTYSSVSAIQTMRAGRV